MMEYVLLPNWYNDYWPKKVSQIDIRHIKHTPLNVNDLLE